MLHRFLRFKRILVMRKLKIAHPSKLVFLSVQISISAELALRPESNRLVFVDSFTRWSFLPQVGTWQAHYVDLLPVAMGSLTWTQASSYFSRLVPILL